MIYISQSVKINVLLIFVFVLLIETAYGFLARALSFREWGLCQMMRETCNYVLARFSLVMLRFNYSPIIKEVGKSKKDVLFNE